MKRNLFWNYVPLANYICFSTFMTVLETKDEVIVLPPRPFSLCWINNKAWFIQWIIRYRSQIGYLQPKPGFFSSFFYLSLPILW